MRLIGFVNEGADIKKILDHIGKPSVPPKLSQACDLPLWDNGDAAQSEVFDAEPDGVCCPVRRVCCKIQR
jgi:hypothetical protein